MSEARGAEHLLRIGDVAARVGVSTRVVRHYESQGLVAATRSSTGQRLFEELAVDRVRIIRWLISAGLPTRVIKELVDCVAEPGRIEPCAVPTLMVHLDDYDSRIAQLSGTRETLQGLIDSAAPAQPRRSVGSMTATPPTKEPTV